MTWRFALGSEIINVPCEPVAEEQHPKAIDEGAGDEWVFLGCHPACEIQSVEPRLIFGDRRCR